jgi:SNF2 family DNA or RNA helicase
MVYRLICKNSVEERIVEAAKHKLMLDTMMTHSSATQKKKSDEDQNSLYQILKFGTKKLFEQDQSSNSMDILSEYSIDEAKLA